MKLHPHNYRPERRKKIPDQAGKRRTLLGMDNDYAVTGGVNCFYFTPFFQNVFYSFTDLGEFQIWTTISLDNYINLFSDDEFRSAIYNTLAYVFICVPIITVLSLLLAIGLNQAIRGQWLFRTLLFLPAVTMPAAIAMVWQWLMNRNFGLINQIGLFRSSGHRLVIRSRCRTPERLVGYHLVGYCAEDDHSARWIAGDPQTNL